MANILKSIYNLKERAQTENKTRLLQNNAFKSMKQ